MLEGLDKVNWTKHLGAYQLREDLPRQIRLLLSPDEKVRKQAQDVVFEEIAHQNSVYSATPVVIPFLIEILATENYPDPAWLIETIEYVAWNCHDVIVSRSQLPGDKHFLFCLDTYRTVEKGNSVYQKYLKHHQHLVRYLAAQLLSMLSNYNLPVLKVYENMIDEEKHPIVRAELIRHIQLPHLKSEIHQKWTNRYTQMLVSYISGEYDSLTRTVSALTWQYLVGEIRWSSQIVPDEVTDILIDSIQNRLVIDDYDEEIAGYADDTPLHNLLHPHYILKKMPLFGYENIIPYLSSDKLTVIQTHYLARELMNHVYRQQFNFSQSQDINNYANWQQFDGWVTEDDWSPFSVWRINPNIRSSTDDSETKSIEYHMPKIRTRDQFAQRDQQSVLRAIVDSDKFWEMETNLFSFFYGLPDDREKLRALLK